MKVLFERKKLIELSEVNEQAASDKEYIARCEEQYHIRVGETVDCFEDSGCSIIMVSGPSASGKTTSSYKIAKELESRGRSTTVISLDNFFRKLEDYPKTEEGIPDFEHVQALDVERVNRCLKELIENGKSDIPVFDFLTQRRCTETQTLETGHGEAVIIEGIHALNPILSESISSADIFRLYVGLRLEYSENGERVLKTRNLRIMRRLVRDYYFRGHSVRNTLELWKRLRDGEELWIKPFKKDADMLLDSSFEYEPGVFVPILKELLDDPEQGGEFRHMLQRLWEQFVKFDPIELSRIPAGSMLREFVGGLEL